MLGEWHQSTCLRLLIRASSRNRFRRNEKDSCALASNCIFPNGATPGIWCGNMVSEIWRNSAIYSREFHAPHHPLTSWQIYGPTPRGVGDQRCNFDFSSRTRWSPQVIIHELQRPACRSVAPPTGCLLASGDRVHSARVLTTSCRGSDLSIPFQKQFPRQCAVMGPSWKAAGGRR